MPTDRQKSLPEPAGTTPSAQPDPARPAATSETVPSPPTATTRAWPAAAADRARSVAWPGCSVVAASHGPRRSRCGRSRSHTRSPFLNPATGLTTKKVVTDIDGPGQALACQYDTGAP